MAVGGKGARPADWPGARPHVYGVWGCAGLWVYAGAVGVLRVVVQVLRVVARVLRDVVQVLGGVAAVFVCERACRGASVTRGSNALDGEAMH